MFAGGTKSSLKLLGEYINISSRKQMTKAYGGVNQGVGSDQRPVLF